MTTACAANSRARALAGFESSNPESWVWRRWLLAASIAFILARSLHKSVGQALDVAGSAGSESVAVFALLKAVEYGCLGYLLAIVSSRVSARMAGYGGTGLAVGLVFGAIALYRVYPQPMPALVARGINEIVFPIRLFDRDLRPRYFRATRRIALRFGVIGKIMARAFSTKGEHDEKPA